MPETLQTLNTLSTEAEIEFAGRVITRIRVAYPNQAPKIFDHPDLAEEAMAFWGKGLIEMVRAFGQERVESALNLWLLSEEYMPQLPQIRERIPPPTERNAWDPDCPDCHGNGWRYKRFADGRDHTVRCVCLRKVRIA